MAPVCTVAYIQGRDDSCTVLVNCREKGRFRLHTGTYVCGSEGKAPSCCT